MSPVLSSAFVQVDSTRHRSHYVYEIPSIPALELQVIGGEKVLELIHGVGKRVIDVGIIVAEVWIEIRHLHSHRGDSLQLGRRADVIGGSHVAPVADKEEKRSEETTSGVAGEKK
eukprot:GGOE01040631.1.p1 GENE.GGOE01040631.1~~GGOE01040631.1.p1  ORF type:complete len:115 (-),score=2.77 GGOE01040631.1:3-347(-)